MKKNERAWHKLSGLIRPQLGAIIFLNVLTVLQALVQVALAVVTKLVIDAAVYGTDRLLTWALVLGGLLLGVVVMHALHGWYTGSTTDKCVARMRLKLLDAATHSSKERLQEYHSGQLLSRGMEDVFTVCEGFVVTLPGLLGQLTRLIGAFVAVIVMYPTIAPILIAASFLVVGMTALLRPIMRKQHKRVRKTDEKVMSGMQENFQQLELIQGLQMEETVLEGFSGRLDQSLATRKQRRKWSVGISSGLSLISQLGTGGMLLWGGLQVAGGVLSYGSLTAMLQLLSLLRNPVVSLSGVWTRLAAIEVAAGRLQELLEQQQTPEEPLPEGAKPLAVVFENVTFAYPGEEAPVLEQFSARFSLEGWSCLTGVSGKGKSTIFKLMLGLYEPQKGRVYVQTDRGEFSCSVASRRLFAYVPQDYSLLSGSVRENLLLASPNADANQRKEALRIAQADFVWELAAGEESQVLENSGLSKGQLQRLAIARAVLMDRQVFLLDECSSALDAQTEEAMLEQLLTLGKSAIVVTHRPDALREKAGITFVELEE